MLLLILGHPGVFIGGVVSRVLMFFVYRWGTYSIRLLLAGQGLPSIRCLQDFAGQQSV